MVRDQIESLILEKLKEALENNGVELRPEVNSPLIGSEKILDSVGLVNFIIDVETAFIDLDKSVSLMSENAMSARVSPFRSVKTLCDFIENQLNEE